MAIGLLLAAIPVVGLMVPTPSAVVTTADGSRLLAPLRVTAVPLGTSADATLTVDADEVHQSIVGFGASLTESSAVVLMRLPPAQRATVMSDLFSRDGGLGLSILRQPVGGSEFVSGSHYSYDDIPTGQKDLGLQQFSVDRDKSAVLPLLRQADGLSGQLTVIASPWSAPAWMKSSGSMIGGRLRSTTEIEQAYIDYLTRFVAAYRDEGVAVDYLTVQNEPQLMTDSYPGMKMAVWQQIRLLKSLAVALDAQGTPVKLLGYDHNWGGGDDFLSTLVSSSAADLLAGIAYHCYAGTPADMRTFADRVPAVFLTECSGSFAASDSVKKRFSDTLNWHARTLVVDAMLNGSSSLVTWNLALDQDGGPHVGGCSTCSAVITVDSRTGNVTRNAEYYTLGHLSRYVQPGAVRVGLDAQGRPTVHAVAFRNPDGGTAVLIYSDDARARTVQVRSGNSVLQVTVPAQSLSTVVIPG